MINAYLTMIGTIYHNFYHAHKSFRENGKLCPIPDRSQHYTAISSNARFRKGPPGMFQFVDKGPQGYDPVRFQKAKYPSNMRIATVLHCQNWLKFWVVNIRPRCHYVNICTKQLPFHRRTFFNEFLPIDWNFTDIFLDVQLTLGRPWFIIVTS